MANPLKSILGNLTSGMGGNNGGIAAIMPLISKLTGGNNNQIQELLNMATQFRGKSKPELQKYIVEHIQKNGGMSQEQYNQFKSTIQGLGINQTTIKELDSMIASNPDLLKK